MTKLVISLVSSHEASAFLFVFQKQAARESSSENPQVKKFEQVSSDDHQMSVAGRGR